MKITLLKSYLITLAALLLPVFVHAQPEDLKLDNDKPIDIEADLLYQDKARNIFYGKGKVLLIQGQQRVLADELIYHRNEDVIYAKGHVFFAKEDGTLIFADEAKFLKGASQGVAVNFKGRSGPQGLLAAKGAEIIDENHIKLHDFAYTACKICQDNLFSYVPLWEVRSGEAEINRESQRVDYYNSTIGLFGVPIFYTPYFNSPAPGAKRKSGLLLPKASYKGLLGKTLTLPVYFNLAPNADATYSPRFTEKAGTLHQGEFRYLHQQGGFTLRGSYGHTSTKVNNVVNKENVGHYALKGNYKFTGDTIPGFVEVESKRMRNKERTFLKKFDIDEENILKTDVNYRYFAKSYYYSLRSLNFQDLRLGYNAKTTSAALPVFDAHLEYPTKIFNSKVYSDVNFLNLARSQGTNYHRFTVKPGIKSTNRLLYGNFLNFDLSLRADAYEVRQRPITVRSINQESRILAERGKKGKEARMYPEFLTQWRWPLYNQIYGNAIILEPVVDLIAAPRVTNLEKLTNEDSLDPEITAGNLFSNNRYKGYDKIESGNRINYGLQGNLSNSYIRNINFTFGQSRRASEDKNFTRLSGMDGKYSDYVGKVSLQLNKHITLIDNFRIDKKNNDLLRNLSTLAFSYDKFSANITYSETHKKLIDPSKLIYTKEYIANATYNFYREWSIIGNIHGRFGKKPPTEKTPLIKQGLVLKYAGDCLISEFGISRDYTKLKDLKPSTTYIYSLDIPIF